MQIIEVRNDIFKLAYSPFQNGLMLSDFLLVTEGTKSVLSQVIGIESSEEKDINIAYIKGCLSVDNSGKINSYVGFTPSTAAEITQVAPEQILSMLIGEESGMYWGYLAQHDNVYFQTENELIKNKPLILMDNYNNYNVIVNNLAYTSTKQNQKTLILDFDGTLKIENAYRIKVCHNYKLPLSYNVLNYIYENDFNDETLSAKAIIQDVIIELQEYIKTLSTGFLPFSTIKDVIYAQYTDNKCPELMLLKNKFIKYAQQNFLAEDSSDFDFINKALKENDIVIIDASELDTIWHKLLLNNLTTEVSTNCYFITKLENDNSDKKTILNIYNNNNIFPILSASYMHKELNVLKSIAKNLILFAPNQATNDIGTYAPYMQKLSRDEYVVCGENTLYLSFIVKLTYIDSNMAPDYIEEEIQADVDKLYRSGNNKTSITGTESIQTEIDIATAISQNDIVQNSKASEIIISEAAQGDIDFLTDDDLDFIDEIDSMFDEMETFEEKTETFENNNGLLEDEIELENPNIAENEITENENNTQNTSISNIDKTNQETIDIPNEEIQKSSTTKIIEDTQIEQPKKQQITNVKNTKQPKTPIPVYQTEETNNDEPQAEFKEGNFVYHEKYGKGVIEKIIKYGNKSLYSIQFEGGDVGRRLLDPALAGLKQI